jgi:DNA-directed RNA polymerase subunit K/omega
MNIFVLQEELMRLISSDDIRKVCRTNYEAVLIAAKYARKLNADRIAQQQSEDFEEEEEQENPRYKVASQALYDLVDGKIKFTRS